MLTYKNVFTQIVTNVCWKVQKYSNGYTFCEYLIYDRIFAPISILNYLNISSKDQFTKNFRPQASIYSLTLFKNWIVATSELVTFNSANKNPSTYATATDEPWFRPIIKCKGIYCLAFFFQLWNLSDSVKISFLCLVEFLVQVKIHDCTRCCIYNPMWVQHRQSW